MIRTTVTSACNTHTHTHTHQPYAPFCSFVDIYYIYLTFTWIFTAILILFSAGGIEHLRLAFDTLLRFGEKVTGGKGGKNRVEDLGFRKGVRWRRVDMCDCL